MTTVTGFCQMGINVQRLWVIIAYSFPWCCASTGRTELGQRLRTERAVLLYDIQPMRAGLDPNREVTAVARGIPSQRR